MSQAQTKSAEITRELDRKKAEGLLEEVLDKTPSLRSQVIHDALDSRIQKLEEVLPDAMKGQAPRLVKRAAWYFSRKPELEDCSQASFIKTVLEAAELGLAIDGRLAYAIPYNNKKKQKNAHGVMEEISVREAQLQIDYKGLVAVARRAKLIKDVIADVVREGDTFEHGREGPTAVLRHSYDHRFKEEDRGKVVGAYAILVLPDGWWKYEYMDVGQLEKIRNRSKAAKSGPWVSDYEMMCRKTPLRRILKLYLDDPVVERAVELDEREYEEESQRTAYPPVGRFSFGSQPSGIRMSGNKMSATEGGIYVNPDTGETIPAGEPKEEAKPNGKQEQPKDEKRMDEKGQWPQMQQSSAPEQPKETFFAGDDIGKELEAIEQAMEKGKGTTEEELMKCYRAIAKMKDANVIDQPTFDKMLKFHSERMAAIKGEKPTPRTRGRKASDIVT